MEIKKLMGLEPENTVVLLRKMGYRCEVMSGGYQVYVPGNRVDVMGPADVIEDIKEQLGSTFAYSGLVAIYYWGMLQLQTRKALSIL